jgi:hypothetical protein
MLKRFRLFSLLLLVLTSPVLGQVTLVRKLNEGDTYKTKTSTKTDQKLTIAGQDAGTTSNTVLEQKTTVGKRDADGKLAVTVDTNILSSAIGLPGGIKITFDAKNSEAKVDAGGNAALEGVAKDVADKLKANAKSSTTIVLDKDYKVVDVKGIKPESGVNADDIKDEFAEQLKTFSDKPLMKGDTWEREVKLNLGGGQVFTVKRKYTYEGETSKSTVDSTRKVQKITAVDSSVVYSTKEGGALPFKVTKSDLKVEESKNTILFDPLVGRSIDVNSTLRVSGKIGLSFQNQPLEGDLDLTMSSQVEEIK